MDAIIEFLSKLFKKALQAIFTKLYQALEAFEAFTRSPSMSVQAILNEFDKLYKKVIWYSSVRRYISISFA